MSQSLDTVLLDGHLWRRYDSAAAARAAAARLETHPITVDRRRFHGSGKIELVASNELCRRGHCDCC